VCVPRLGAFASALVMHAWRSMCIGDAQHIAAIFERI